MNIREYARNMGGDELVADVDWGRKIELAADRVLAHAVKGLIEAYTPETQHRNVILRVAIVTALSRAYTKMAVEYATAKVSDTEADPDRAEIAAIALRSVVAHLEEAWTSKDAETGGVADLIRDAAKKGDKK